MSNHFELFLVNYSEFICPAAKRLEHFIEELKDASSLHNEIIVHQLFNVSPEELVEIKKKKCMHGVSENSFSVCVFFDSEDEPAISDPALTKELHTSPDSLCFYTYLNNLTIPGFDNCYDIRFQILLALRYFFNDSLHLEIKNDCIACRDIPVLHFKDIDLFSKSPQLGAARFIYSSYEKTIKQLQHGYSYSDISSENYKKIIDSAATYKKFRNIEQEKNCAMFSFCFRLFVEGLKEKTDFPVHEAAEYLQNANYRDCFDLLKIKMLNMQKAVDGLEGEERKPLLIKLAYVYRMLIDLCSFIGFSVTAQKKTEETFYNLIWDIVFENHICFDLACDCILHKFKEQDDKWQNDKLQDELLDCLASYKDWENSKMLFTPSHYYRILADAAFEHGNANLLLSCLDGEMQFHKITEKLVYHLDTTYYMLCLWAKISGKDGLTSEYNAIFPTLKKHMEMATEHNAGDFNVICADIFYTWGVFLYETGNIEEALSVLKSAYYIYDHYYLYYNVENYVGKTKTCVALMKCYRLMNRPNDAMHIFSAAIKFNTCCVCEDLADVLLGTAELHILMSEIMAEELLEEEALDYLYTALNILKALAEIKKLSGALAIVYSKAIISLYKLEEIEEAHNHISPLLDSMPESLKKILDELTITNITTAAEKFDQENIPVSLMIAYCNIYAVLCMMSSQETKTEEEESIYEHNLLVCCSFSEYLNDFLKRCSTDDSGYIFISVLDTIAFGVNAGLDAPGVDEEPKDGPFAFEAYYEKLASMNSDCFSASLAEAYCIIAKMFRACLCHKEESDYLYKALSVYDNLASQNPEKYNLFLARVFLGMAKSFHLQNLEPRAEFCYQSAVELFKPYTTEEPSLINKEIAECYIYAKNIPNIPYDDCMKNYFLMAKDMLENIHQHKKIHELLGICYYTIARESYNQNNSASMEKFWATLAIDTLLDGIDKLGHEGTMTLSLSFHLLGSLCRDADQTEEFDEVIAELTRLVEKYPNNPEYRVALNHLTKKS